MVTLRTDFTNTNARDIRRGGATANAPEIATLAKELHGYQGAVLVVTNPVDLMVRRFAQVSGCARVYGIGSNLDSARYRLFLARFARVSPERVEGHVIGEHGDLAVPCLSTTTVNGHPVTASARAVVEELQQRPALIRAGIGRTRCGPAGAVLSTLPQGPRPGRRHRGAVRSVRGRVARHPAAFHRGCGHPVPSLAHAS
ncbi:hypothetical protein RB201_33610 [Streptomyces sp. S1A(2023)]